LPAEIATPLLRVVGATKRFLLRGTGAKRRSLVALDDVDLTLRAGETVGVVGESGSGKSTLGKALLRLLDLDAGSIALEGRPIESLDRRAFRPLRARLQMVFQNPATSFNPKLTIEDTLVEAMRLRPDLSLAQKRDRARELLEDVELGTRFLLLYPHEMSGGQLQRVAIARALAPSPKVIFLDEPTAALDMSIRGQVVNMLRSLQRQHDLGFIFVSHDLRVIRYVADQVIVMYLGEVVESGSKAQLFETPRHPYTRALFAAVGVDADAGERPTLRGEIASAGTSEGCRLAPRCPHALERCFTERQRLRELAPSQLVRCWRADPSEAQSIAPKGHPA
jgi:peptide/nickel transport system ATP-binding protein/oligopeptide transport system ATP-binding protein